jgi:hypothetical protein
LLDGVPDDAVVTFDQVTPAGVGHARSVARRLDEVGDHHGREHAIDECFRTDAGHELLRLSDRAVHIVLPGEVLLARKLEVTRAVDAFCDVTAVLRTDRPLSGPMHHEGRHANRRQDRADVDLPVLFGGRACHRRARGELLASGERACFR